MNPATRDPPYLFIHTLSEVALKSRPPSWIGEPRKPGMSTIVHSSQSPQFARIKMAAETTVRMNFSGTHQAQVLQANPAQRRSDGLSWRQRTFPTGYNSRQPLFNACRAFIKHTASRQGSEIAAGKRWPQTKIRQQQTKDDKLWIRELCGMWLNYVRCLHTVQRRAEASSALSSDFSSQQNVWYLDIAAE